MNQTPLYTEDLGRHKSFLSVYKPGILFTRQLVALNGELSSAVLPPLKIISQYIDVVNSWTAEETRVTRENHQPSAANLKNSHTKVCPKWGSYIGHERHCDL